MRRLLIFVVLFAAGLGLLLVVDRRATSEGPDASDTSPLQGGPEEREAAEGGGDAGEPAIRIPGRARAPDEAQEPEPAGTELDAVGESAQREDGIRVGIGGRFESSERERSGDREVTTRRVTAVDVVPRADGDRVVLALDQPVLQLYDRGSGAERTRFEARGARAVLDAERSSPGLDPDEPIAFEDVTVTLLSNLAFAPLEVRVPTLQGLLADERFTTEDPVAIEGRGIVGAGRGLELGRATLRLREDVRLTFSLPERTPGGGTTEGELSCPGPLTLERRPDLGPDGVAVLAQGEGEGARARFALGGPQPVVLEGETLELVGLLREDVFVPTVIITSAAADVALGGNRFRADRGRLEFDAEGEPASAMLVGRPTVELPIAGPESDRLPLNLPGQLALRVRGSGPLELELAGEESFRFLGPLEVRVDELDVELDVAGELRGRRAANGTFQELQARGGVTGRFEQFELRATAVDLLTPNASRPRLSAEIIGPSTLMGKLEDGRAFALEAAGRSLVEISPENAYVRRAEDVVLRLDLPSDALEGAPAGVEQSRASAALVSNFDLDAQTFEASGDVRLSDYPIRVDENEADWRFLSGEGERLVHQEAREQLRLLGSEERPVVLQVGGARLEGLVIDVTPSEVAALGNARASVEVPPDVDAELGARRFELRAQSLRLEQRAVGGRDLVRLTAERDATLQREADGLTLELAADRIVAVARSGGPGDEPSTPDADAEHALETGEESQEDDAVDAPLGDFGQLETDLLTARGQVEIRAHDGLDYEFRARGAQLLLTGPRAGYLRGTPDDRVHASGRFTERRLEFDMLADMIVFGVNGLSAVRPDVRFEGFVVPMGPLTASSDEMVLVARAEHMTCDENSVIFSDNVHIRRAESDLGRWSLDAGFVALRRPLDAEHDDETAAEKGPERAGLSAGIQADLLGELIAWDGFTANFGPDLQASGDRLHADGGQDTVRLVGSPAIVRTPSFQGESDWLEWESSTGLLRADHGRLSTAGLSTAADGVPWTMTFTSMEPLEQGDVAVQVVRQPTITNGDSVIRASWAVFWVDPDEWTRFSTAGESSEKQPPPLSVGPDDGRRKRLEERSMPSLISPLMSTNLARWLREGYIEGDIEYFVGGRRLARADAMYLDLVVGHGWLQHVELRYPLPFSDRPAELKLSVDWLRHSADGSMRADDATLTTCMFEKPHYRIRTGDLRLTPRPPERGDEPFWELEFNKNAIVFGEGFALPLPDSFPIPLNREGMLHFDEAPGAVKNLGDAGDAVGGQTARFGTFLRARFIQDIPKIGLRLHELLGGDRDKVDGRIEYDIAFLGSRGFLLGVNPRIEEAGLYFLDLSLDAVFDTGEDRGLLRVDEDERDDFRRWFHLRGRYEIDDTTWIDLVATTQSDFGVQSEFWENETLAFEERQTFIHWRRAKGADYAHVTASVQSDDFRTEVEKLPEAGYYKGGTKLAEVGSLPLVYSSDTNLGYYRRQEGEPGQELFTTPFADGLGEEDVLRADTRHRFELPASLGDSGLRATPYLEGRATIWDHGVEDDEAPLRTGLIGGIELAGFLWKQLGSLRHEIVPTIGVRSDLALEESGDAPIAIDGTEEPLDGLFVDFGLRQRFVASERTHADVFVRATWGDEVEPDGDAGWLPVFVNNDVYSEIAGIPFAIHHDARYALEGGDTPYSRVRFGFEPVESLALEFGHDSGRGTDGPRIYDAYTVAARFRPNEKWEFEGRNVFASQRQGQLASSLWVRRFGHDLVFELEVQHRAGEGSGFAISLTPVLTWRDRRLGLLDLQRTGRW